MHEIPIYTKSVVNILYYDAQYTILNQKCNCFIENLEQCNAHKGKVLIELGDFQHLVIVLKDIPQNGIGYDGIYDVFFKFVDKNRFGVEIFDGPVGIGEVFYHVCKK